MASGLRWFCRSGDRPYENVPRTGSPASTRKNRRAQSPLTSHATLPKEAPLSNTTHHNDRIPTDPTHAVALLLLAAALTSQLTPDQTQTLTAVFGLAGALAPHLPRGGR